MKNHFVSLFYFLLVLGLMGCNDEAKHEQQQGVMQNSGAFDALNFLGQRTTYPNTQIPENAYFQAWETHQRLVETASQARGVMPWESMGPVNQAGRTLTLEFNPQNPNTLWIGTASGGLWRSYTEGLGAAAWHYVETGFPVLGVSSIAFQPADSLTLYIGTGEVYNYQAAGTGAAYRNTRGSYGMGILKSTDGGETWALSLDWSYDQNRGIWAIKIDPQNNNIIYAATTHGVYKSIDAGINWEQKLDVPLVTDLVIHPENPDLIVIGAGNFGSPNGGIHRSEDGGETWDRIVGGLPIGFQGKIQLNYAPSNPNILYASIGNGFSTSSNDGASWFCRSASFGSSWSIINETDYSRWQGWFAHDIGVSIDNPNKLVVVGIRAWRTVNGGLTLVQETSGGGPSNPDPGDNTPGDIIHSDCHDVKFHPTDPEIVYVTSDGGVHRSTDSGRTYQFANGGLQNCQFYNGFSNAVLDETFCLGGLQDNGTIRWNGDDTWTAIGGGDGAWTAIHPQHPNIFYTSSQYLSVRRRDLENQTTRFMQIPSLGESAFIAPYVICPSDGNVLYAGNTGVAKTIDGGDNWELTNSGEALDNNPVLSMAVGYHPDVVYCGTAPTTLSGGDRGNLFVTTNGGASWHMTTGNLPDRYPMDIAIDPTDDATAYVVFSGFGSGHVYKTTDYGENWIDISGELPDIPTNAVVVDPLYPDHVYVGNDLGVYVTTDGGETWGSYQNGLYTATMIFDLSISLSNRKLRAATHGNGAYQRDLLEEGVSTSEVASVEQFSIYPNPTASIVTVSLKLAKAQNLELQIVDAFGRIVQKHPNAHYSTDITQVTLDCSKLAEGTYFVLLKGREGVQSQKLVVARH